MGKARNIERLERIVARGVVDGLLRTAVLEGKVNVDGKSEDELRDELFKYLKRAKHPEVKFLLQIDHRKTLLSRAREAKVANQHEMAALFYATWIEHWLSSAILSWAARKEMSKRQAADIVRATNINAKCTWVLQLLSGKPLPANHVRNIQGVSDVRNAFIHYKWQGHDIDDRTRDKAIFEAVDKMEPTIKFLKAYERRRLLANSARSIRKLASRDRGL